MNKILRTISINAFFSPASLASQKEGNPWHSPVISARILRWWMSVRDKNRHSRSWHRWKRNALFMFSPVAKIRGGQVGRDISSGYICRRYKNDPFSSRFLSRTLPLPLPDHASPLVAVPQVVCLVRVIQGISAETDVGVDRRVSFSHPSTLDRQFVTAVLPLSPFPPPMFHRTLPGDAIELDKSCDKLALLSAAPRGIPIWIHIFFPGREEPQIRSMGLSRVRGDFREVAEGARVACRRKFIAVIKGSGVKCAWKRVR